MNKIALILVTHIVNESVILEYRKMKNTPYVDAFLAINNHERKLTYQERVEKKYFYGVEVNCFFFDEVLHEEIGLPYHPYTNAEKDFGRVVVYNSDNHFYYFKKYLPDYEYYWRFEYDVFCNSTDHSYSGFLEKFKNNNDDLIIGGFRPVIHNSKWSWSKGVEWIYGDVPLYGSFFPVVRLSNKAVDFLYKKRLERSKMYNPSNKSQENWPFCELFVPTELMNGGFSCSNLDEPNLRWRPFWYLNDTRVFEEPDNRLYHPVKIFNKDLLEENNKLIRRIRELEMMQMKK